VSHDRGYFAIDADAPVYDHYTLSSLCGHVNNLSFLRVILLVLFLKKKKNNDYMAKQHSHLRQELNYVAIFL